MALHNSKLSGLLSYLDSQEHSQHLDNICSDSSESFSDYSSIKIKLLNLNLELEESNKIISSLKLLLDKQKFEQEAQERYWQDKLKRELEIQQKNYEETIEKNLAFIETLVRDKEQKLQLINELQSKLHQNEENAKVSLTKLNESWQKELKKAKDSWITTERVKREKWEKEKVKEIKEMTARGLEPEITRIVTQNRRLIEEKEEDHRKEIKSLRDSLENKYSEEIKRLKDNLNYKHDAMMEKEREIFSNKIKELSERQETELSLVRSKWNQEMIDERNRLESYYLEEIKVWKEKATKSR